MGSQVNKAALKVIDKAIRAVERKIPFKSEKARNEMLSYAAGDMAEAYQIGAEEAQGEFLARLQTIRRGLLPKPATWFDGGYLGNGHCSFMWARNGEGACCRLQHGHEGAHVADSQTAKGTQHE
jgi:hypothetical protein